MNPLQNCKFIQTLAPISVNGAYTTTEIDCLGFHYATVVISAGLIGAADFTVAKVQAGNVTGTVADITTAGIIYAGTTAGAAVTGVNFIGTGSTPADTDDGKVWVAFIDLRKITYTTVLSPDTGNAGARFLKFAGTSGAASVISCLVILSMADNQPLTPAGWGAKAAIVI